MRWPKIDLAKLANTVDGLRNGFAKPAQLALDDVLRILNNGATITDNMKAAWIEFDAVHGVEARTANPLGVTPMGFMPVEALTLAGSPGSYRLTGTKQQILGAPVPNFERADKALGFTVQYDLAHTQPSIVMRLSANTAGKASGASLDITDWDVTERDKSSATGTITNAAGIFTASEAGLYSVSGRLRWAAAADYTQVQTAVFKNGAFYNGTFLATAYGFAPELSAAWHVPLAAGDSVSLNSYQVNGAAAARANLGGVNGCKIAIARLYNDTLPTARVRGILWGG